jgi:acyl-CoA synthetase (NDP forming)
MLFHNNTMTKPHTDLSRLLTPTSIAIIGASSNDTSISGQPLRLMIEAGYAGKIYPVNPKRDEVQGVKAYPDAQSIPGSCDVALVAVSAAQVPQALRDCGKAGIPFAVVLAGGFEEIGEAGMAMQRELNAAIKESGVRVVGPNCIGVANIATRAFCAFGGALYDKSLEPGPVAVVSQSGGVGLSMLAHAHARGVDSRYIVSCGNEADLNFFDFCHTLLAQDDVKLIMAYLESSTEGVKLRELGQRALQLGKPIILLKVGNSGAGRRAAGSHTGKLTADYTLFKAAFNEGGFIEVQDLNELADVAKLVLGGRFPKGRNIGVLTGSGGWGVMTAEAYERNGLHLPLPSVATAEKLKAVVADYGSRGNPIDTTPVYGKQHTVLEIIVEEPNWDMLHVRSAGGPVLKEWLPKFLDIAKRSEKPIIVGWAPVPGLDLDIKTELEKNGIYCPSFAADAGRAVGLFTDFAMKRRKYLSRSDKPEPRLIEKQTLEFGKGKGALAEHVSKQCLARYGIPVTKEVLLPLDVILALKEIPVSFPVAVKLASADIPHKTEADAVRLGVKSLDELKAAAQAVTSGGKKHAPSARIDGISVQEMAAGVEMIVGAVNDPHFGPYVMVGLGGVLTEVLHDVSHRFAPVTAADAREMLASLKGAKILEGYRGAPPVDVEAVVDVLVRLSLLISDHREQVAEIDINPLFVRATGKGVVAADALVVLQSKPAAP